MREYLLRYAGTDRIKKKKKNKNKNKNPTTIDDANF